MNQILVDTNVLVSFLTDRDASQQEKAAELFAAAASGGAALVLHQVVITELVHVLSNVYRLAAADVAATVGDLLALPGVATLDEIAWPVVLDLWPGKIPGFTDAVLAAVAQVGRYEVIATFDLKLRRALRRRGTRSCWWREKKAAQAGGRQAPE
jgi:predicted nucleic acid-binding protein